jgi:hypothetical protein
MDSTCDNCRKHSTEIWTPYSKFFARKSLIVGNWIELVQCEKCPQLWVESPYEPYAAFIYIVKWNLPKDEWQEIHDIDNGLSMLEWHREKIREIYRDAQTDSGVIDDLNKHFFRSYGREPFGEARSKDFKADDLLKKTTDEYF